MTSHWSRRCFYCGKESESPIRTQLDNKYACSPEHAEQLNLRVVRQKAFEDANPHLQFKERSSFRSLGGLLIRNPGSRSGLRHIQHSVWGRLSNYESSRLAISLDHPRMYWCRDAQRYIVAAHPYAKLPDCDQSGDGCECIQKLRRQVTRVNQAHLETLAGQRNKEQLIVYVKEPKYSWYHETTLLVVVASNAAPINLLYFDE